MSIAINLKMLRIENQLSQKDMSELLNINLRTYASYERGEREPGAAIILKICQAFNISSDVLLSENKLSDIKSTNENKKAPRSLMIEVLLLMRLCLCHRIATRIWSRSFALLAFCILHK